MGKKSNRVPTRKQLIRVIKRYAQAHVDYSWRGSLTDRDEIYERERELDEASMVLLLNLDILYSVIPHEPPQAR